MSPFIETMLGGTEWMLLGDRGVYWHKHRALFIADPHFGKTATFRRHGLPVPRGSTDGTLARISRMLRRTEATRMVILGDMFHARSSLSSDVRHSLDQFFATHHNVECQLVRGNHDLRLGPLPSQWSLEVFESQLVIDRVLLSHHPSAVPADMDLMLCGHLHPSIRLDSATDRLGKLPCFWLRDNCLVLPAIGQFTGTHVVGPRSGDRVWPVVDDELIEYPVVTCG
ncbi:MAG: ligase-associated DNA damage response endonuclease PdeM [Pirellulaceae bacterium]|nr:ligase-associated DNA damage response endonuclease PdeM [Pirellulaceae bacterium]